MAADPLLRSVLVVQEEQLTDLMYPFQFAAESCTAADLFNAFADHYGYTWTQEPLTGVIWFHPDALAFQDILSETAAYPHAEYGLPMQRGVLEPLDEHIGSSLRVKQWGTLSLNTFDYPVNIPAGTYTVREVVSLCCIANPSKTFAVWVNTERDYTRVEAVNLDSGNPEPAPGLLTFWEIEVAPLKEGAPTIDMVRERFWDRDPRIRWAARMYYNAILSRPNALFPGELLNTEDLTAEQRAWVALGLAKVHVRAPEATHQDSIRALYSVATEQFLLNGPGDVALLTAMELARLDEDTRALEIISRRKLTPEELEGIQFDLCHIARRSETAWQALRGRDGDIHIDTGGYAAEHLGETPEIVRLPEYLRMRPQ